MQMSDPSDIVHDSSQLAHHSQVCIIRFYIPPPSLTIPQYQTHTAFIASVAEFDLLVINLSCPYPV